MISNKRGGARENAGRPRSKDKKLPLTIYVKRSQIGKVGGKTRAKVLASNAVNDPGNNLKKDLVKSK